MIIFWVLGDFLSSQKKGAHFCVTFSGEYKIAPNRCSKKSVNQKNLCFALFLYHLNSRILLNLQVLEASCYLFCISCVKVYACGTFIIGLESVLNDCMFHLYSYVLCFLNFIKQEHNLLVP